MRSCATFALLFLLGAPLSARAEGALPAKVLRQIKDATVFVKVQSGLYEATGSGFVFHVRGSVAYLATNEHVVVVPALEVRRAGRLPPLRVPAHVGKVKVVFKSGTREEKELTATVIFKDAERDLALLKVDGFDKAPASVVVPKALKVEETQSLYVFGFPFGEGLDLRGRSPAVTVGKGAVSSLREDKKGELALVQVEAELHPGNSGGPVVDARGHLVGIAVARLPNTRIGWLVPATDLTKIMKGRFVEVGLYPRRVGVGASEVCASVLLFDPLEQIESARFHWLPGASRPAVGKGGLAETKGARSLDLAPQRMTWVGHFPTPTPEEGPATFHFQVVVRSRAGETQTTPVWAYRWVPNPKAPPRRALGPGDLARVKASLKSGDFRTRRAGLERLVWAEPGEASKEALEVVRGVLGDHDNYVRELAVRALGTWAGKEGLPDLLRRMKEEDHPWVRWAVIEELGKIKREPAARALADSLGRHPYSAFPGRALRALGPVAEGPVLPLLSHKTAAVRLEACRVLEAVGTKEALPALKKVASEGEGAVAAGARRAVVAIEGRR